MSDDREEVGEKLDSPTKVLEWCKQYNLTVTWPEGDEDYWWKYREKARLLVGGRLRSPIVEKATGAPLGGPFFPYAPKKEPTKIAYVPNPDYGRQDRHVITTVGRFLTKHFADKLSEVDIKSYAEAHQAEFTERPLLIAFGADEIEQVYRTGPQTCMSHSTEHFKAPEHPSRLWDSPDTVVAYMKTAQGKINARALINMAPTREVKKPGVMVYTRQYGDMVTIVRRLQDYGFYQNFPHGARLRKVYFREELQVMPYVDWCDVAHDPGEEWMVIGHQAPGPVTFPYYNVQQATGVIAVPREVVAAGGRGLPQPVAEPRVRINIGDVLGGARPQVAVLDDFPQFDDGDDDDENAEQFFCEDCEENYHTDERVHTYDGDRCTGCVGDHYSNAYTDRIGPRTGNDYVHVEHVIRVGNISVLNHPEVLEVNGIHYSNYTGQWLACAFNCGNNRYNGVYAAHLNDYIPKTMARQIWNGEWAIAGECYELERARFDRHLPINFWVHPARVPGQPVPVAV